MTHAERLREIAERVICWYPASREIQDAFSDEDKAALLAGADALDKLASLPHYDDCDKWVMADGPAWFEVVIDDARECTCALKGV